MSNEQKIEQVHHELELIFNDMRNLMYEVGRHNPGIEVSFSDRTPLPALAQTMGTMVSQLNALRIDLVHIREAEQLEEA